MHLADSQAHDSISEKPCSVNESVSESSGQVIESQLVLELDDMVAVTIEDTAECKESFPPVAESEFREALVDARELIVRMRAQRDSYRMHYKRVEIERDRLLSM